MSANGNSSPRRAAVKLLCRTEDSYANLLLAANLDEYPPAARAYITRTVYGVAERRLTLDYVLATHSKVPLKKMDAFVLAALRLGLYECSYMDSVPVAAAVNETVKLVKASRYRSAAPLCNAVLRAAAENFEKVLPAGDDAEALSIRYSCPQELVGRFMADLGQADALGVLQSSLLQPPKTLRVNTEKVSPQALLDMLAEQGIDAQPHPQIPFLLQTECSLLKSEAFKQGLFFIEDAASALAAMAAAPAGLPENPHILDCCAAPGGKSYCMAMLRPDAEIISADLHEHRAALIAEGARRLGLRNITTKTRDAAEYAADFGEFDSVLCDVPCSGYGIMNKKPDIKYRPLSEAAKLPEIQQKILDAAARYVKPGGLLTYSTCTILAAENACITDDFLQRHSDFAPHNLDMSKNFTCEDSHSITLLPHKNNTDGFYICQMKRI